MTDNRFYRTWLWTGLAAALLFAPVARGAVRIWALTPVLLVEYILIFSWLWKANNNAGYQFVKTGLGLPVALFACLAILSSIFSVYKHDSIYALLKLFGYIGVFYLIANEFDHAMRRRLAFFIVLVGAGLSIYGILQYFGLARHDWWFPQDFLSATYVNHNHFAGYLEMSMPVAAGLIFVRRADGFKLALVPAIAVMMTALILTQSRGAWISLGASALVIFAIFALRRKFNLRAIFMIFLLAFTTFSLLYFSRDIISRRMDISSMAKGDEASLKARLDIWRGASKMIAEKPLVGSGIGTFTSAFPSFRPEGLNVQANAAHNDYLQVAAEMGLPALFVMIWLLTVLIRNAIGYSHGNPLKLGCAIGLLSLSMHGLVDFNFNIPANMLLFTVCAGLAATTSRDS